DKGYQDDSQDQICHDGVGCLKSKHRVIACDGKRKPLTGKFLFKCCNRSVNFLAYLHGIGITLFFNLYSNPVLSVKSINGGGGFDYITDLGHIFYPDRTMPL